MVLCNFIGGLGVGALASRRITEFAERFLRLSNRHRIYGAVELGVTLSALRHYAAVVDANSANAFALVEMGTILHETGKQDQAAAYFRRAKEIDPVLTRSRLGSGN